MVKEILVIAASPRVKSASNVLADAFIKGVKKNGHNVTKISLSAHRIEGCQGCERCFSEKNLPCVFTDDDMALIYEAFIKADLIVFASPVYYFSFPSQLKAVIDRLYPFGRATRFNYPKKEALLILSCGDNTNTSAQAVINYYKVLVEAHFKWLNRGVIVAHGVNEPAAAVVSPAFKEAQNLGESYI